MSISSHVYINLQHGGGGGGQYTDAQPFRSAFSPETKNANELGLKYIGAFSSHLHKCLFQYHSCIVKCYIVRIYYRYIIIHS